MNNLYHYIKYRLVLYPILLLVRFFLKENKILNHPHFFILGSGRNGSTLLATILNAHKNIVIPPEQFLLPYIIIRRYLLFPFNTKAWLKNVKKLYLKKEKTTNWQLDISKIKLKNGSISEIFNQFFLKYKVKHKKEAKYWGDKSPLNTNFIKYIYPEFIAAKYIFLIRDPRDVMLSYKKMIKNKSKNYYQWYALMKWEDSIRSYDYLKNNTEVHLIRYEDLINDTNNEIKKIQDFLSLDVVDNLSLLKEDISSMGVKNMSHHQNLNKPISNTSIGKWKNELSKDDLRCFNKRIKLKMKRFNYS